MGLKFVIDDYLKSNATSASDNYNILGARCDFLKNKIAGELNMSVLTAAQLNRAGEVGDSMKINRYLSVGIKWFLKTQEQIANDGLQCGNAGMKIYINRLGEQMPEDDENAYKIRLPDAKFRITVKQEVARMTTMNTIMRKREIRCIYLAPTFRIAQAPRYRSGHASRLRPIWTGRAVIMPMWIVPR